MVMIDIVKLGKEVEKFVSSWTSRNGGESVRLRGDLTMFFFLYFVFDFFCVMKLVYR